MRTVNLCSPETAPVDGVRLARLTRHLHARLLDFDPGGPEVVDADQAAGTVTARFPGHDTAAVLEALARRGVAADLKDGCALFRIPSRLPFEDLDYVWGCLNEIL